MSAAELAIGAVILIFAAWVVTLTLTLLSERRRRERETASRRRLQARCSRLERQVRANKQPEPLSDALTAFPRQLLTEPRELN